MSKANINANCVSALARELAMAWRGCAAPDDVTAHNIRIAGATTEVGQLGLAEIVSLLSSSLFDRFNRGKEGNSSIKAAAALTALIPGLGESFEERLFLGALQFIDFYRQLLSRQGLTRHSESGLLAFFLSAIYETLLFDSGVTTECPEEQDGGRRKRIKRRGAAYFTPPSLAYFAAHQALSCYFAAGSEEARDQNGPNFELPLPTICDPAMGTGLYLVAALDYLRYEKPELSPSLLAGRCLYGVDFDAITCSVARDCLNLAAGSKLAELSDNLSWADGLVTGLTSVEVVLSNPPWDIVKTTKITSRKKPLSRVNKARSNALRQTFSHQGEGDTSYYKLFLERTYQILKPGGVAAVLTPGAFCGDKGAAPLRTLISDHCQWISLDGFINEDNAFAIHPHFKYLLLCFRKGFCTESIKARFGLVASKSSLLDSRVDTAGGAKHRNTAGGEQVLYDRSLIRLLGGPSGALLELYSKRDVDLLTSLYQKHLPLRDSLRVRADFFRREFDMTMDHQRFLSAKQVGRLRNNAQLDETYLPLFEGRMIGQFDSVRPEAAARFFVKTADYRRRVPQPCAKIGFVSITSAYNTRSMIAAYLPDLPAGNSLPTLVFRSDKGDFLPALESALYTVALFNSFVFDALVRLRLSGNNLSYHLLEDLPFPSPVSLAAPLLQATVAISAMLSLNKGDFSAEISALCQAPPYRKSMHDFAAVLTPGAPQLLRLRLWLEVLVCEIYALSPDQVAYLLRDCQMPAEVLRRRRRLNRDAAIGQSACPEEELDFEPDQRSFFRVDKGLSPHLRLTNLVNCTFAELKSTGLDFVHSLCHGLGGPELSPPLSPAIEKLLKERFATIGVEADCGLRCL